MPPYRWRPVSIDLVRYARARCVARAEPSSVRALPHGPTHLRRDPCGCSEYPVSTQSTPCSPKQRTQLRRVLRLPIGVPRAPLRVLRVPLVRSVTRGGAGAVFRVTQRTRRSSGQRRQPRHVRRRGWWWRGRRRRGIGGARGASGGRGRGLVQRMGLRDEPPEMADGGGRRSWPTGTADGDGGCGGERMRMLRAAAAAAPQTAVATERVRGEGGGEPYGLLLLLLLVIPTCRPARCHAVGPVPRS